MQLTDVGLTPAQVSAVADGRETLTPTTELLDRVRAGSARAAAVATSRAVYGRSTGVGANRTVPVQDPDGQLVRLLRSHSTSDGPPRSARRVRAMVAVRVAQLAAGGSGISVRAFEALVDGLSADNLPTILEGGSIGTGDLSALARIGTWLLDRPGGPAVLPGDALPLISSNAGALGDAALALTGLQRWSGAAMPVAACSLRAIDGGLEAFGPPVERATPFPGAGRVCQTMRALLAEGAATPPARIQDPFGFRAMPQGHGVLLDAVDRAVAVVQAMVNAPSENPVFDDAHGATHHGAFHAAYLAHALDGVLTAMVQSAQLSVGRLTTLSDPAYTGLTPFLAIGTPGASGTMVVELAATASLARLRALAAPSLVHTATISRGVEDDASFASVSATNLLAAADLYRAVLAAELLCGARALRQQDRLPDWSALDAVRSELVDDTDRDLTVALAAAGECLEPMARLVD